MSGLLPPYLVTPLPKCSIVVDRHVHKNGGSTLREVFAENDMHDGWTFWGYSLHQNKIISRALVRSIIMIGDPRAARNQSVCTDWDHRRPVRLQPSHLSDPVALCTSVPSPISRAVPSHPGPYARGAPLLTHHHRDDDVEPRPILTAAAGGSTVQLPRGAGDALA